MQRDPAGRLAREREATNLRNRRLLAAREVHDRHRGLIRPPRARVGLRLTARRRRR